MRQVFRQVIGPQVVFNPRFLQLVADTAQPALKIRLLFVAVFKGVLEQEIEMERLEIAGDADDFGFLAVAPGYFFQSLREKLNGRGE